MTFEIEEVLPTAIGVPTHQVTYFDEQGNSEWLNANLDMMEVGRDDA